MELLIVVGFLALISLAVVGAYVLLGHRRAGTIKAVLTPRRSLSRAAREAGENEGSDTAAS